MGRKKKKQCQRETDWSANPSMKWPRSTIAWLMIRMMKTNARVYGKNKIIRQSDEFKALGIPPEDGKLWDAVVWPVRDIIEDSLRMQWFTAEFGDEIFTAIKDMPFAKPSDSYTGTRLSFEGTVGACRKPYSS